MYLKFENKRLLNIVEHQFSFVEVVLLLLFLSLDIMCLEKIKL